MANAPELEAEYAGYIADMKGQDEQFARQQEAIDWGVVQGWTKDKDGGISSWLRSEKAMPHGT